MVDGSGYTYTEDALEFWDGLYWERYGGTDNDDSIPGAYGDIILSYRETTLCHATLNPWELTSGGSGDGVTYFGVGSTMGFGDDEKLLACRARMAANPLGHWSMGSFQLDQDLVVDVHFCEEAYTATAKDIKDAYADLKISIDGTEEIQDATKEEYARRCHNDGLLIVVDLGKENRNSADAYMELILKTRVCQDKMTMVSDWVNYNLFLS